MHVTSSGSRFAAAVLAFAVGCAASCGTTPIPAGVRADGGSGGGRDGGVTCEGLDVGGLRYLETGDRFERDPTFAATATRLYYARYASADAGVAARVEVQVLDPFAAVVVGTRPLPNDELFLDAIDSAELRARPHGVGSSVWSLVLRVGDVERVLGQAAARPYFADYQRRVRALSPSSTRVTWRGQDGVYLFDGRVTARVGGLPAAGAGEPTLDDAVAAVEAPAGDGGPRAVYVIRDGVAAVLPSPRGSSSAPVVSGERIFYLSGGAAILHELSSGQTRELDPGPCHNLDAQGGQAVFSCGAPDGGIDVLVGHRVVWFDGATTRLVPTSGRVFWPRIRGGVIAWVQSQDPNAGCQPPGEGQLMAWLAGTSTPSQIAETGLPCLCCGAYWPPLRIELGERFIAWSYGRDGSPVFSEPGRIGYARVSARCP